MTWQVILIFITAIVGLVSSIISGLVMYTFKSVIVRLEKHDARLDKVEDKYEQMTKLQAACKIDCTREFVTSETFIRSSSLDRAKLDQVNDVLNKMLGKMTIVEELPKISGEIAAAVTKQVMEQVSNRSKQHG